MKPQISIITTFFNAEKYLKDAIESVIDQDYSHWELLLINDGSKDTSEAIARSFTDSRIRLYSQTNKGVSAARNVGLEEMNGDYFCFLDADDVLPAVSLSARLQVFQRSSSIQFVDGGVEKWDADLQHKVGYWRPSFTGNPFNDLLSLSGKSFFGPSWMVKRMRNRKYQLLEGLTHGEDLLFYADLARDPSTSYAFTEEVILRYRVHSESAMQSSLKKLENGYRRIYEEISAWPETTPDLAQQFRKKTKKIMCKSYLRKGELINAIKAIQ